jgi:hypothetical protein
MKIFINILTTLIGYLIILLTHRYVTTPTIAKLNKMQNNANIASGFLAY